MLNHCQTNIADMLVIYSMTTIIDRHKYHILHGYQTTHSLSIIMAYFMICFKVSNKGLMIKY